MGSFLFGRKFLPSAPLHSCLFIFYLFFFSFPPPPPPFYFALSCHWTMQAAATGTCRLRFIACLLPAAVSRPVSLNTGNQRSQDSFVGTLFSVFQDINCMCLSANKGKCADMSQTVQLLVFLKALFCVFSLSLSSCVCGVGGWGGGGGRVRACVRVCVCAYALCLCVWRGEGVRAYVRVYNHLCL